MMRFVRLAVGVVLLHSLSAAAAYAQSACAPDALQQSGSIYRICMPPPEDYNGRLVIWAHGFQDAGTPVSIPEDQMCFDGLCLPDLMNGLGFAFATNSYSKTGLAILQGRDDILDLVNIFIAQHGAPERVYVVGASEGGIITTLLTEQHPDVFDAGVAACGPIGSFEYQINYFGNARATFEFYWPGLIPGDPFAPSQELIDTWSEYYVETVEPAIFAEPAKLRSWAKAAKLPVDPDDLEGSLAVSARDVLRYGVVNLNDAVEVLGGFPFDNMSKIYIGSGVDLHLNRLVPRAAADAAALTEMRSNYDTTGQLEVPLVTIHTTQDQQVPFGHEPKYMLKTLIAGVLYGKHRPFTFERYGHCNFTADEALFAFTVMLLYAGDLARVEGVGSLLEPDALERFEARAALERLPYQVGGNPRVVLPR